MSNDDERDVEARRRLPRSRRRSGPAHAEASARKRSRDFVAQRRICYPHAHGSTFSDQTDGVPFDFDDPTAQRNLNDKGKALARSFGDALREIGVPVGKVFTSKFNRAYETATLAGFKPIERTDDLTLTYGPNGLVMPLDENNRRAEALRKMLTIAPTSGTNTILITHQPNIVDALGKDWSDVREGEALVFRPEKGTFTLVARIPIEEWPQLVSGK